MSNFSGRKAISLYIFSGFMVFAGSVHFINPQMFEPFIPDFLPKLTINYLGGVVEIGLGLAALWPNFRRIGTLGILLLMWAFLPLHFFDMFKDLPAVGSHTVAYIRFPMQFLLIYWAWRNYQNSSPMQ